MTQQVVTHVRVGSLTAGKNPRQVFNASEMAELEQSIKEKGILQPILVRPLNDGYQIIAGERRYRAAKAVHGEDWQMPVLVVEMTDAEADEAALIENVARANMSPAEEAEAAAKILGNCEGNRDEAAKRLGWSRTTLDKRLALMNCSDGVRKALMEGKISLGHAELFAAAPKERQERALERMLERPTLPTVAEFKASLAAMAMRLDEAIFDKTECGTCAHNSSQQATMFSNALAEGNCTNGACYTAKTTAVVEETKQGLLDEFPRVEIVNPGENFTFIKLVAEGATGVGEEQAKACRACKDFGAVVSNVPGKFGRVFKDQCFDSACNTGKVAARIKAEKEAEKAQQAPANPETGATGGSGKAKVEAKAPAKAAQAPSVQDSKAVKEYRVKEWRKALKRELQADSRENLSVLIGVLMVAGGGDINRSKLSAAFEKLSGSKLENSFDVAAAAGAVSHASDEIRQKMLDGIAITIADAIEENKLVQMLKFMQVDMTKHWQVNVEFMKLLTKSEIEVLAEEIGLKAHLGEKYSKAMSGKKDEIIKALLETEGFEFTGKLPKSIQFDKQ